jgi:hypothetical protein
VSGEGYERLIRDVTIMMGPEAAGLDTLVAVERARAAALAVGHATTDELDQ